MAFCDWLLELTIMFSRFIPVAACISISYFSSWNIPLCEMPRFAYEFTSWRLTAPFPHFGYCEQCYEYSYIHFCWNTCLQVFWIGRGAAGSYGNSMFNLLRPSLHSGCSTDVPTHVPIQGIWFLHILANAVIFQFSVCLFLNDYGHPNVCEANLWFRFACS